MHNSKSSGVAGQPIEAKGRGFRGICETDADWGVAGGKVNREFTTSKVLSGSEEGDIAVNTHPHLRIRASVPGHPGQLEHAGTPA